LKVYLSQLGFASTLADFCDATVKLAVRKSYHPTLLSGSCLRVFFQLTSKEASSHSTASSLRSF